MDKYIYHRVLGSVFLLSLLSIYVTSTFVATKKHLPNHPELQVFHDLGPRYNTIWNMIFLIIYAIISLACDVSTIMEKKEFVPQYIRQFRFNIFHRLLFPLLTGMIVFWLYFFYDRELVFPTVIDILISPVGNFVFHGLGIIYVFWELIFLPKDVPERSGITLKYLAVHQSIYLIVVLYTRFIDMKVWMYDVLTAFEGTILFPLVLSSISITSILAFHTQFRLKDYVWSKREEKVD